MVIVESEKQKSAKYVWHKTDDEAQSFMVVFPLSEYASTPPPVTVLWKDPREATRLVRASI